MHHSKLMEGLLLSAPSRWKPCAVQHGWKVEVGFKQVEAWPDPSEDEFFTVNLWNLLTVLSPHWAISSVTEQKQKGFFSRVP